MTFAPRRPAAVALACAALLGAAGAARGQCRYRVHVIAGPDCSVFEVGMGVRALDAHRNAVGWMSCPEDDGDTAFVARDGFTAEALGFPWPGVWSSRAFDVSAAGDIVGSMLGAEAGSRAFIQRASGETIDLGTMDEGTSSEALGVNEHGHVAGYWSNAVTGRLEAFVWLGDRMIDIGPDVGPSHSTAEDINGVGQVTGWQGPDGGVPRRAFLWKSGGAIDLAALAGGAWSWGYALNDKGHVVGKASDRAALWRDGSYVDLGVLPGTSSSFARDINELDQIVGNAEFSSPAFLWQKGTMHDLNDLAELPPGVALSIAYAINDAGEIGCAATWNGPPSTPIGVVLTPIERSRTDVDGDCRTDADDLATVLAAWGSEDPFADVDGDGLVAVGDLLLLLAGWDVVETSPSAPTPAAAREGRGRAPSMHH